MGIRCALWEETPERVEYYLANRKWQNRNGLNLRFFSMGKDWTLVHRLICPPEMHHSFPANFIENGTPLPNYEIDEMDKDNEYVVELTAPFLYSVEKTKIISEFLNSLTKDKIRQACTHQFWIANGFSKEMVSNPEKEEDGFCALYCGFEEFQRFFQRVASDNHCVIGRKS
ncbi:MAG: YfbM family protein [Planctomycetaceae bacterium]|nr:YfbM family protein [Planctomycetaceae bacterium]